MMQRARLKLAQSSIWCVARRQGSMGRRRHVAPSRRRPTQLPEVSVSDSAESVEISLVVGIGESDRTPRRRDVTHLSIGR